jgi:hypothetical protein
MPRRLTAVLHGLISENSIKRWPIATKPSNRYPWPRKVCRSCPRFPPHVARDHFPADDGVHMLHQVGKELGLAVRTLQRQAVARRHAPQPIDLEVVGSPYGSLPVSQSGTRFSAGRVRTSRRDLANDRNHLPRQSFGTRKTCQLTIDTWRSKPTDRGRVMVPVIRQSIKIIDRMQCVVRLSFRSRGGGRRSI